MDELLELAEPLIVGISKDEVDRGDVSGSLGILRRLMTSPRTAATFCERVDVMFSGYNHRREELWEIPEVRAFVSRLDSEFPFWFFFLSRECLGLQCIVLCMLPPFLTDEARARVFPALMESLLLTRWLPAMNHVCSYAGFDEADVRRLTESGLAYLVKGRLPGGEF